MVLQNFVGVGGGQDRLVLFEGIYHISTQVRQEEPAKGEPKYFSPACDNSAGQTQGGGQPQSRYEKDLPALEDAYIGWHEEEETVDDYRKRSD